MLRPEHLPVLMRGSETAHLGPALGQPIITIKKKTIKQNKTNKHGSYLFFKIIFLTNTY